MEEVSHCLCCLQVRVVDLYVVEGPKVLHRLGLAAMKLFTTHIQAIPAGSKMHIYGI